MNNGIELKELVKDGTVIAKVAIVHALNQAGRKRLIDRGYTHCPLSTTGTAYVYTKST